MDSTAHQSNDRVFIILAAGSASRYNGEGCKQMLCVDGECLLHRMVRLFSYYGKVYIATNKPELTHPQATVIKPENCQWTSQTILSTRALWGARTTILLGDVYYSEKCINLIVHDTRPCRYYGDGYDIFAWSFDATETSKVVAALEDTITKAPSEHGNFGRIWQTFKYINGYTDRPRVTPWVRGMTFIADRTQDFDSMDDYQKFLDGVSKNYLCKAKRRARTLKKQLCQWLACRKTEAEYRKYTKLAQPKAVTPSVGFDRLQSAGL